MQYMSVFGWRCQNALTLPSTISYHTQIGDWRYHIKIHTETRVSQLPIQSESSKHNQWNLYQLIQAGDPFYLSLKEQRSKENILLTGLV